MVRHYRRRNRRYRISPMSSVEMLLSDVKEKLHDELCAARTVEGVRKVIRKFADNDELWKAVVNLSKAQDRLKAVKLK